MKKYLLLLSACLFSIASNAQENSSVSYRFSLEDRISYALDKNYNKQSLKLSEESKAALYSQSKSEKISKLECFRK